MTRQSLSQLFQSPARPVFLLVFILILAGVISLSAVVVSPLVPLALALGAVVAVLIWRSPFLGVALITFALPFERLGAYEFQGTTIRLSQILLLTTVGIVLLRSMFINETHRAHNSIPLLLAPFLAVNVISLLHVQNFQRSISILLFTAFTMLLVWLVPRVTFTKRRVRTLVHILLLSALIVSLFGIFQFLGDEVGVPTSITGLRELYTKGVLGFPRIQSTAYEPLYFANYLILPLTLALCLLLSKSKSLPPLLLVGLLVTGGISFVLTVSRGAYLGLAGAFFIVALFFFKRVFTLRNIILVPLIAVAVWFIVVRTLGFGGDLFSFDKFTQHVQNVFVGASYDERVFTIEQAMTAWSEHPIVGIGVGAFGPYTAPHPFTRPTDGWKIVNNEFIEILAETGMLGLAAFVLFISIVILRSFRAIAAARDEMLRALMIGTLAALIGALIQYLTFSTLYIMHIWFLVGLAVAAQNLILYGAYDTDNHSLGKKS